MTSDPLKPRLVFITVPENIAILNIQIDGQEIQRFELTRGQLLKLNAQNADALWRGEDR